MAIFFTFSKWIDDHLFLGIIPTAGERNSIKKGRSQYKLQCLPLYSLILAAGNPTVDYLSLDVEGAEMKVLRTIPFDKVDIRVFSIEVNKLDKSELASFMAESGYRVLRDLKTDLIFVK